MTRSPVTLHRSVVTAAEHVTLVSDRYAGVVRVHLSLLLTPCRGRRWTYAQDSLCGDSWLTIRSHGSHGHNDSGGLGLPGGGGDVTLPLIWTAVSVREGQRLTELISSWWETFSLSTDHLAKAAVAEVAWV